MEKARIAVAGCGHWGKNIVRVAHELGVLVALDDADATRAAEMSARYAVPAPGWRAILDDPSIAGVMIATPAAEHARMAREALEAGKHVFVEKPLSLQVADGAYLVELAAARCRKLMVGHLLQYHPAFLAARETVAGGALGRLQYVASSRLNLGKLRREEDSLWSFAPHDISMILALVGEAPESVTAVGAPVLHARIADVTTTHLSFANGAKAHVHVSWLHPVKEQKLVVVGDKGMLVFDDGQKWPTKLVHYPHRIEWREGVPEAVKADGVPIAVVEAEPLRLEVAHFVDCVLGRIDRPRTDGNEALDVLRVLDASARAMASRGLERLDALGGVAATADADIAPTAFVHESAYVDTPARVAPGAKIWHFSHVLARTTIGENSILGQNVVVGPDVTVGRNCKIQNNVSLYKGVTLEDGVFCGPSCVFTNVLTPRAEVERKNEFLPTLVKRGATIGANATVVCGNTLGSYAMVAAGAVVTKDVPDHALVAGVPARRVGWVSRTGDRLGPDLVCPRTGERYRETAPDRLEIVE